jgi:hypothetical protein
MKSATTWMETRLLRPLYRFAGLLLSDQVLEGPLVLVLELLGVEVPGLRLDDVCGEVEARLREGFIRRLAASGHAASSLVLPGRGICLP